MGSNKEDFERDLERLGVGEKIIKVKFIKKFGEFKVGEIVLVRQCRAVQLRAMRLVENVIE